MLRPLVERAALACGKAHEAARAAVAAQELVVKAESDGGYWLSPLKERATARSNYAARLLVDAYVAAQEAQGAGRAIDLARRGEPWRPFDLREAERVVFFGETPARAVP